MFGIESRSPQILSAAVRTGLALLATTSIVTACGSSDAVSLAEKPSSSAVSSGDLALVSAEDAAAIIADPPADLVILDVRTPEEFGEGHIEGAVMLDFYREDFAAELAKLEPDVPYLVYCRSGNRSGQTATLMDGLEFESVTDVDGGVVAWQQAGLPLTRD